MRAVIYARFSTDKQRETSIDDQARVCRTRSEAEGWTVGELYSDIETSGQTRMMARAGAARMLAAIGAGGVDVLVIEALDRLARDLVEQETIVRRLEHKGLRIVGVADGYDTALAGRELMRAVRGAINESYIRDLRFKIHRGLAGQISRGFHAGGISYGYRSIVAGYDAKGEPIGHRLEVDEEQACIVREIFQRYAGGWSCQRIAADLNARHIKGPRGGTWCVSALYGSPNKGSGVLNNEIYIGRYVWNRSQWGKDPDTGRRVRKVRPQTEWRIEERPELRIVDDAQWAVVRGRIDGARLRGRKQGGRPASTLFGGMLKCGICGGAVVAINQTRYGCAAHKDRGAAVCAGLLVKREDTDARLLSAMQQELQAPQTLVAIRRQLTSLLTAKSRQGSFEHKQKRLRELEREIPNLTEAIAVAGMSEALRSRLAAAEAEQQVLKRSIEPVKHARPTVDAYMAHFKRSILDMKQSLRGVDVKRAREALATLYGEIRLVPVEDEIYAEFSTAGRLLMAAGVVDNVVAGMCSRSRRQSGCGSNSPQRFSGGFWQRLTASADHSARP